MKYQFYFFIILSLFLNGSYAQNNIPPVVDLQYSTGFGNAFINNNRILSDNELQINNVLIRTKHEIDDPFNVNNIMWGQTAFDVIFKACRFEQTEYLLFTHSRLSGTVDFIPFYQEGVPCSYSNLNFSIAQIIGIEANHNGLQIYDIHRNIGMNPDYFDAIFEFNLESLILESKWEYQTIIPQTVNISLNWSDKLVHDLDLHLTGPAPKNPISYRNVSDRFHIYFADKNYKNLVSLDIGEFGRTQAETITILSHQELQHLEPGSYLVTVHNFTNNESIELLGATIQLQIGDISRTFTPPAKIRLNNFSSEKTSDIYSEIWVVCELQVTDIGKVIIIPVQKYDSVLSPSNVR